MNLQYPMPDIIQVPYSDEHIDGVTDLLGNADFKKIIWRWQFQDRLNFSPIVLVDRDRQVTGFNGVMPVKVSIDGEITAAAWSCDFVVSPKARRKGVGKQVKLALQAEYSRVMSLGISDSAVKVLKRMGWRNGGRVLAMRRLSRKRHSRDLVWLALQKALQFLFKRVSKIKGQMEWLAQLPEKSEVDSLNEKILPDYQRCVIRDYEYLNWRYQQHPLASYQFLALRNEQELAALLVLKVDKEHVRIVDYLGPGNERNIRRHLLREVDVRFGKKHMLSCTSSDVDWLIVLAQSGFLPTGKQRFYIYSETDSQSKGWYLMAGDSDGELLQAAKGAMRQ
ncbi:GNAT family N-acetyltransferase [Corallincola holothuriorum]|uniref:GNAT family N-acetyltransferase n=1 Tax=Corallincola holothuriorum TaxID=2282215 RepID=A0A368N3V0_9GAMM|nr:GNAT family N-acetyltransferase [Corallincola holothuriorum]RCU45158.1 GNAT family N-acetyltransferase [Corallincola holothuriorum]